MNLKQWIKLGFTSRQAKELTRLDVKPARYELYFSPWGSAEALLSGHPGGTFSGEFERPYYVPSPADLYQSDIGGARISTQACSVLKTATDNFTLNLQFGGGVYDLNLPDLSRVSAEFDAFWGPLSKDWRLTLTALVTRLDTGAVSRFYARGYDYDVAVSANANPNRLIIAAQQWRLAGANGAGLTAIGDVEDGYSQYMLPSGTTRQYAVQFVLDWEEGYL